MKVEKLITSRNKERYMLVGSNSEVIEPVLRFLKYKDNVGAARNTLKAYCYHLKLFFEFLEQENLDFTSVKIDNMAYFVAWLQNPLPNNVIGLVYKEPRRSPRTVNMVINTVLSFYDYLMRHEDYQQTLSERLKKNMSVSRRGFKDFLYHINKDKTFKTNILKVKMPKVKLKVLAKEDIERLLQCCTNSRDYFLVRLLWESSIRIGEALSLWLEDFEINACKIHIKDRGELENQAEIKTVNSPRTIDVSMDLMNEFMQYISHYHTDEVDTNFVFIKLTGTNEHRPMQYQNVVSLFKRLKLKSGIPVNPHMLRHSSLTELRRAGWKAENLRIRAGHKNFQTTFQMYIHPSDEDLRADWEKVEKNMRLRDKISGGVLGEDNS